MASRPVPLWRNRDFLLLWSGQNLSWIGTGVSQLAFPLLTLALTGSPAQAGLVGALAELPYFIFSLPAGVLIDHWDRKRVMVFCEVGRMVSLASIPIAFALGSITVVQLYVVSLIDGTLFVFFNLAETASLSCIVPKEQLPDATALYLTTDGVTNLLGAPLGGVLYSAGRAFPFLADAISYVVSALSVLFMKASFQQERAEASRNLWAEITEGLSWLWHHPDIFSLTVVTFGLNLVFPSSTLIVIVLAQHQHASPTLIGIIFAFGGIGYILGTLLGSPIQRWLRLGYIIIGVCWLFALLWPLFAVAPTPLTLGAILIGLSLIRPIHGVVQFSYRLIIIPDELQGRVNSIYRLISLGSRPLGLALTGVLIQSIGVVFTILIFGVCLVTLAIAMMLNPHIRHMRPPSKGLIE